VLFFRVDLRRDPPPPKKFEESATLRAIPRPPPNVWLLFYFEWRPGPARPSFFRDHPLPSFPTVALPLGPLLGVCQSGGRVPASLAAPPDLGSPGSPLAVHRVLAVTLELVFTWSG